MIDIEKKIAEHTLKKLHKKSWNTLTLDDVIEKKNKKQKFIKSKTDLLRNLNRYVDMILIDKTKNIEITIFIDHFLIEVFINNIQSVVGICENFENKNQINAYSFNGPFIIEKLLIWKLKKINSGYKKAKKNKIWRVKEKI